MVEVEEKTWSKEQRAAMHGNPPFTFDRVLTLEIIEAAELAVNEHPDKIVEFVDFLAEQIQNWRQWYSPEGVAKRAELDRREAGNADSATVIRSLREENESLGNDR